MYGWGARLGTGRSVSVSDSQWGRFLNLKGVDGIISSENCDGDGGRVSSDNCFEINKIKLGRFCSLKFNLIIYNWTCIMIGWI